MAAFWYLMNSISFILFTKILCSNQLIADKIKTDFPEKKTQTEDKYTQTEDKYTQTEDKYTQTEDKYTQTEDKYTQTVLLEQYLGENYSQDLEARLLTENYR